MRERFTDEEWALVRLVPVRAGWPVMRHRFDEPTSRETDSFLMFMFQTPSRALDPDLHPETTPQALEDPLHREIAEDWNANYSALLAENLELMKDEQITAEGAVVVQERFHRAKDILQSKLSPDEYQSFVGSIWKSAAAEVPEEFASGRDGALRAFATVWEIDPQRIN